MNLLIRTLVYRQSSLLISRRNLVTERSRRAFRSSLIPEKLRSNNQQRPFGFLNEKNIILGIIAVNGIVFITWRFSYANLRSNHDQRLLWFMTKNFSMYRKNYI
jgi:Golgi nucleoside diphosphatase